MGQLIYNSHHRVTIEDRALAHLEVVIWAKLRRQEPFGFTYVSPMNEGTGRIAVWLSPSVPLEFTYYGGRPSSMSRAWLRALAREASSPRGLQLLPEPPAEVAVESAA